MTPYFCSVFYESNCFMKYVIYFFVRSLLRLTFIKIIIIIIIKINGFKDI